MTIVNSATSLKSELNKVSPQFLADALRIVKFGDVVRGLPTTLRKKDPVASSYQLATLHALALPDSAKAAFIFRAYARATSAAGPLGELAVVGPGVTPATGEIAVAPNGDIVTLAADAYTSVDVHYLPTKYDLGEVTLPVVANVLTLPVAATTPGVVRIFEAEALVGTSVGKKIILMPGAGAPAAGQARANLALTTVTFAVADAVTSARVKFGIVSAADLDALLEAESTVG